MFTGKLQAKTAHGRFGILTHTCWWCCCSITLHSSFKITFAIDYKYTSECVIFKPHEALRWLKYDPIMKQCIYLDQKILFCGETAHKTCSRFKLG